MKISGQKNIWRLSFSKTFPAFIVFALSLIITFFSYKASDDGIKEKLKSLFEAESNKVINRLNIGIEKQFEVLKSFREMYSKIKYVVRDVFELYASVPINMYPEIRSISFALRVKNGQEEMISAAIRNEGFDNFKIYPPGKRSEYYIVQYSAPFIKNSSASGFDLLTNDEYKSVIHNARDKDQIIASKMTNLISSAERGFIFAEPVYDNSRTNETINEKRENIRGICFIELLSNEFIHRTLGAELESNNISYSIFDSQEKTHASLIYSKKLYERSLIRADYKVNVGGREWTVEFNTLPGLELAVNTNLPIYIFFGGIVFSFLLFSFTFSLLTSRSHAEDLAAGMLRSQNRIVDSSHDLICSIGLNNIWLTVNPASKFVLGFEPEEILNQPIEKNIFAADKERVIKLLNDAPDEEPIEFEARFQDKDNNIRWISWSSTASRADQKIYMIGRDITEKKKTDQLIHLKNYQLDLARIITDQENLRNEEALRAESVLFRSQLQSIAGYLEVVIDDAEELSTEQQEFLQISYQGTKTMLESVENVIEMKYSKISDVSFKLKKFLLNSIEQELTKKILDFFDGNKDCFNINFKATENITIAGDDKILIDSLLIFITECDKIIKNIKLFMSSSVNIRAQEIYIFLAIKGFSEVPEIFRIEGIKPGIEIEKYTFAGDEFRIFIAKSLINVVRGSVNISMVADDLLIKISLPLEY